jgi:hypothetical protein
MTNVLLSKMDWAQDPGATIIGGLWLSKLPATNLLKLQPQAVAQAVATSLNFTLDLGATRTIDLVHFQRLVVESGATIRVTAGSYDSGTVSAWPSDAFGTYDPYFFAWLGRQRIFLFPSSQNVSSISVSIAASAAPIQIGFMGACERWEQPKDMEIHFEPKMIDEADIQRLPGGSSYVTLRGKRRALEFGSGPIDDPPASISSRSNFTQALQLALVNGKSAPVIAIPFPDDTANLERNAVWGLISTDMAFDGFMTAYYHTTWQIEQLI